MGQAWCKERSSKAQDSKSPLDRVFVRCAHRIYPSLKEEGSVLGGATQRVTSSEIGYAGSPPREVLTRGRSIDSVDRPFHPSDWVDVNLEVPSTPRASSVLTNLTVDTSLYPATTPTSSCSNLKDPTPVPPPRRRKRNRGRPLPPKPDEIAENPGQNPKQVDGSGEPLYSSVRSPKTSGDEHESEDEIRAEKPSSKTKEVYEHKVNGTGRIISSDVVSGKRTSSSDERKTWRASEPGQQQRKVRECEEYERFARQQSAKDSSTPNRQDRRKPREGPRDETVKPSSNARPKNYSTVSLPNYDELDVSRHPTRRTRDPAAAGETRPRRPVRSSTGSLPAESFLSPFSEKTTVRLEDYIPRRGSSENLSSYQVLRKLDCSENGVVDGAFVKYDPSKLEDWELGDIGNCELNHHRRLSFESPSASEINDKKRSCGTEDVVDFSRSTETGDAESSFDQRNSRRDDAETAASLEKPVGFGKTPSPVAIDEGTSRTSTDQEEWIVAQNRPHMRYFDPPTLEGSCRVSAACDSACSPTSGKPFFLNESKNISVLDTIGESRRNGAALASDRSVQSRMILGRSLSNESEPQEDAYETKELRVRRPASTDVLIRTISEESLPCEMLEDDFFEEKLAKDARNEIRQSVDRKIVVKTPPPSPEPRIRAEILDNDHSTLLKVLKEEAAEGSNLSSMTPSLTELEAALSDMLEREDTQEERVKNENTLEGEKSTRCTSFKLIEPDIVPVEKTPGSFEDAAQGVVRGDVTIESQGRTADKSLVDEDLEERTDEFPVSLGQILEDRKPAKGRKVSFCAWEENRMPEVDLRNDRGIVSRTGDSDHETGHDSSEERLPRASEGIDVARIALSHDSKVESRIDPWYAPEKPSRLHLDAEDLVDLMGNVPTPPRRKNKGSLAVGKKEIEGAQNGSAIADPYPNDRLI